MQPHDLWRSDVRETSPRRSRRYIRAAEVRALLGISETTLWRYLRDPEMGFPRPIKLKRALMWTEGAIEAFLEAHARKPSA